MKTTLFSVALLATAMGMPAFATQKPRIFITKSTAA